MTPWQPWNNVRPVVVLAANLAEEVRWLIRFLSRSMASQMDERFPPVRRWQWFYGIIQAIVRRIEGVATKGTQPILT